MLEEAGTSRKVFRGERKETGVHVEVARQRQVGMQGVHQGKMSGGLERFRILAEI